VAEGAFVGLPLMVTLDPAVGTVLLVVRIGFEAVTVTDGNAEDGKNPLQSPPLQVLYAQSAFVRHDAWKLPHCGISIEFVA